MVLMAAIVAVIVALGALTIQPKEAEAAAVVRTCNGGEITLSDSEKRSLDLHNRTRVERGLKRLCIEPHLQRAARAHSREMIEKDYFGHNSYNGETVAARLKRFGYTPYLAVGENIGWGSGSLGSADSIFRSWMNSPHHRDNLLRARFDQVGIGAASGDYKGTFATAWTADFGDR